MARKYSNVSKVMSLTAGINNSVTSLTVNDASGLPVTFPYAIAVDYESATVEIMLVTNAAGNVLTVTRGQEDTSAQSHSTGAVVVHVATALDLQNADDHHNASQNVHGLSGGAAVVGTTTSQTLTNKTISGASNTLSAIPGSALTGAITVSTIPVANVTGDWPIDTRSTGSIPVDTRTTGNLPGSRLASPITAAMTFSNNVTVNQPATGFGIHISANAAPNSEALRVTAVSTQPGVTIRRNNSTATGSSLLALQTEAGTNMVNVDRAGKMLSTTTIEATDFIISGSPDRNVKTELDDVLLRAHAAQLADFPNTGSTSYVSIGTQCGTAFTAASTGKAKIDWFTELYVSVANNFGLCTIEVRDGSSVGTGTIVVAAADSLPLARNDNSNQVTASAWHVVTGLTPGSAYNVRLMYRTSAGTLNVGRRSVTVEPWG